MVGRLLLAGARDRLLWGFPLLRVPASNRDDAGWVIKNGAAIGMDERLACQITFIRHQ